MKFKTKRREKSRRGTHECVRYALPQMD